MRLSKCFYFFSLRIIWLLLNLCCPTVYLVYVAHDHPLDRLVPQGLPRCGALATSHDEHGLRAGAEPPAKDQRVLLVNYQCVEMLLARSRK